MELKWLFIATAIGVCAIQATIAYRAHTSVECKAAYANSPRTPEEIQLICAHDD